MAGSRRRSRMAKQALRRSVRGGVAWLTLNRPAAGNAVSRALAQDLVAAAESIALDDAIRLVVIGAVGKSFCQGVAGPGEWQRSCDWIDAIARLDVPVVATIQGDAVAEGCELALACDLRLTSEQAHFRLPQLLEGRFPCHGATQRLPRIVGRMRALDILLSGRPVTAMEAEAIGLATRVLPARSFASAVRRIVGELSRRGPLALRYAKEAVRHGLDLTLDHGIRLEEDLYVLLQTTADRAEGVRAFRGKRRPRFKGV